MKEYKKESESSYIMYWDPNNLCKQEMSQKLPVDGFEWKKDLQNQRKFRKKM